MGTPEMPPISATERNLNAAGRAQVDDAWAAQVLEESMRAAAAKEAPALSPERAATKATVEAELQALSEEVAAKKAKRAIVQANVKALTVMVGGPMAGESAAETARMIQDLKAAQAEFRNLDVATLMSEQKLAAREADYRKDFPETLN